MGKNEDRQRSVAPKQKHSAHPSEFDARKSKVPGRQISQFSPITFF